MWWCSPADLLDDLQTRFGLPGEEADGQATIGLMSATPSQAWARLLAGLRFRAAVAADNLALAQLSLQTSAELAIEPDQVIIVAPYPRPT